MATVAAQTERRRAPEPNAPQPGEPSNRPVGPQTATEARAWLGTTQVGEAGGV